MHELMCGLVADGWAWKYWTTKKPGKGKTPLPVGYFPGQELLWFSTRALPCKLYLVVLWQAKELNTFVCVIGYARIRV